MQGFDGIKNNARGRLRATEEMPGHKKLLDFIRRLKQSSMTQTNDAVDRMRRADRIYHAFRVPDDDDEKASERGEPIKIIYPVTYAQIQTTLAALMTIFDQSPVFPLEGRQPQSYRNAKLMELELDYQLEQAGWTLIKYQWFMDMLKYGFAPLHVGWERQMTWLSKDRPIPVIGGLLQMMGLPGTMKSDEQVVGYEGCAFEAQDPYNFLWDASVSVGEIQKGQYVFNNWKRSFNECKMLEDQGEFFNVDSIPERTVTFRDKYIRRERDQVRNSQVLGVTGGRMTVEGGDTIFLDTCYVKLVPKEYELSELDRMQIWKITMANDAVIVQAEPSRFEHGLLPVNVIEYNPDKFQLYNDGMAQVIDGLQDLINWLLNTHMDNVRKVMNDVLIVDPAAFNMSDLEKRSPILRLAPTAKAGIDRYIKQLQVTDVTQGHIGFAQAIFETLQRTTGVNDNTMGMQADTVRSATEVANVQRLAAGRMTLLAKLLWDQGMRPLGKQLIQNTQQFSSIERLFKVSGGLAVALGIDPGQYPQGFKVGPQDLQGFFSISMIEACTPSDKMMRGNVLKEFLISAGQNPQVAALLGANLGQIATQMFMDFGIRNTTDFLRPPAPDQNALMLTLIQAAIGGAGGNGNDKPPGVRASVQPDTQVLDEVDKGNLVPADGGRQ